MVTSSNCVRISESQSGNRGWSPLVTTIKTNMLKEFADWFSTKNPGQQRQILLKLEEIFQVQNNFGYIQSLKDKIQSLQEQVQNQDSISELKKKLSEANIRNGMLLSEISELKDRRVNLNVLVSSLPKSERNIIKTQLVGANYYSKLARKVEELEERIKFLRASRDQLLAKLEKQQTE